ncbi:cytochrome P450 [Sistotremastrum suecicum HHB10207 ss-3]|uniref:Cytochrome P450 n=1 Tax=Sistotremastrum suecicum HHB10207 ss-3 TaxID=1314776 RepID=A0A166EP21_9AGAM|nr:cytochrome P450 [Sistotremastrum suecicum HHB10207 ss-3]
MEHSLEDSSPKDLLSNLSRNDVFLVTNYNILQTHLNHGWFYGLVLVVTCIFSLRYYGLRSRKRLSQLPGPKGLPFLGNALQIPLVRPWLKFMEWASTHGNVYSLTALGMKIVIVNSCEDALELMHKRSAIYSDRPRMEVIRKHGGWSFAVSTEPYGPNFHLKRRMINQFFNPTATHKTYHMLSRNALAFARSALDQPMKIQSYNRRYSGANIMKLAYGHEVVEDDDQWIVNADKAVHELESVGAAGIHPIDIWPILGKLPLQIWGKKFVRNMAATKEATREATTRPYDVVKRNFFKGTAIPSMATSLIEANLKPDGRVEHEEAINGSLAMTYLAGADTTVASIDTFIIAMIHHPEIQLEAQKTIDELLQGERLPTFEDRASLPYVEAILREVLRWKPVLPGGVPHCVIQDDEYRGMSIASGSMIFPNLIGMMYDSTDFLDPLRFSPRRFLKSEGNRYSLREDVRNPEQIAFGFGRRICPGRHFATAWMWITIATFLAVFEISPCLDDKGEAILPDLEYEPGLVSHPKKYKCHLRPRTQAAAMVLHTS